MARQAHGFTSDNMKSKIKEYNQRKEKGEVESYTDILKGNQYTTNSNGLRLPNKYDWYHSSKD